MSWKKVSFDCYDKCKDFNRDAINDMLDRLKETYNLFCNMKRESIMFEDCLFNLIEQIEREGELSDIHIDTYNRLLCGYVNKLKLYQCTKVQSDCGLGTKLIADYTDKFKTNTVRMNFKWLKHGWMNCKELCIIDNMLICNSNPCPEVPTCVPIYIGCATIIFRNVIKCEFKTTDEFRCFICEEVPDNIHILIAHFIKNMDIIEKCIEDVEYLTEHYDLVDKEKRCRCKYHCKCKNKCRCCKGCKCFKKKKEKKSGYNKTHLVPKETPDSEEHEKAEILSPSEVFSEDCESI